MVIYKLDIDVLKPVSPHCVQTASLVKDIIDGFRLPYRSNIIIEDDEGNKLTAESLVLEDNKKLLREVRSWVNETLSKKKEEPKVISEAIVDYLYGLDREEHLKVLLETSMYCGVESISKYLTKYGIRRADNLKDYVYVLGSLGGLVNENNKDPVKLGAYALGAIVNHGDIETLSPYPVLKQHATVLLDFLKYSSELNGSIDEQMKTLTAILRAPSAKTIVTGEGVDSKVVQLNFPK